MHNIRLLLHKGPFRKHYWGVETSIFTGKLIWAPPPLRIGRMPYNLLHMIFFITPQYVFYGLIWDISVVLIISIWQNLGAPLPSEDWQNLSTPSHKWCRCNFYPPPHTHIHPSQIPHVACVVTPPSPTLHVASKVTPTISNPTGSQWSDPHHPQPHL